MFALSNISANRKFASGFQNPTLCLNAAKGNQIWWFLKPRLLVADGLRNLDDCVFPGEKIGVAKQAPLRSGTLSSNRFAARYTAAAWWFTEPDTAWTSNGNLYKNCC